MQIVVNHLTRMQPGYICVAGIDTSNGQHIRPVQQGRLTTHYLALNGGPFGMASLVDLGPVKYCGHPPELEDHSFHFLNVNPIGLMPPEQFWEQLQIVARRSITEIFGSAIKSLGRGCIVDVGTGEASLGCLLPAAPPTLLVTSNGQIRADITDGIFTVNLSVTDIRLYEADHKTPKANLIQQINEQIQSGTPIIVSVGLTRPWKHPDDTVERHYLQVNNFHLKDHLIW
jgi:hypothetical protein